MAKSELVRTSNGTKGKADSLPSQVAGIPLKEPPVAGVNPAQNLNRRDVQRLIPNLNSDNAGVQKFIIDKLKRRPCRDLVLEELLKAFLDEKSVPANIARAIAEVGDKDAVPWLIKALKSNNEPEILKGAHVALKYIAGQSAENHKDVIYAINSLFRDENPEVREKGVRASQYVGSPETKAAPTKVLSDPDNAE
ncbi:MAG: HEAT repeat domain-containing protein [Candidatus ainarchaeum sp.]|nr:HEAT repeat domain-containing protein [Candidatus ainarchaeum sp.]